MVRKGTCQSEKVTNLTENEQCSEKCSQESHVGDINNDQKRDEKSLRVPQENLCDLTESQQKIAMEMITEQAESFAQNGDGDVGCIEGLRLNLELSPLQFRRRILLYPARCMPKSKHYVEDR